MEPNRLVLLDGAESNPESWFCARSFALAADRGVRGVVAHSDPQPRTRATPQGPELVSPSHVGHVYAVQGFAYLGRTRPRRLTVLPDATVLSDRAASKIRNDEAGHRAAEQRLVGFGARPRQPEEDGGQWLDETLTAVGATMLAHGGNHRYVRATGPHCTRVTVAPTSYPSPRR
ncbi:hypothetical protein AB0D10_42795 [Kitasatospora sp. NPDC048545]|uniref:hypothetical protein n=1 Tax=Kitasatospora sp. NPDC048545 TaxID=3157208 RepID=UPI0033D947B6